MTFDTIKMLQALTDGSDLEKNNKKIFYQKLESLEEGGSAFDWIHTGGLPFKTGKMFELISKLSQCPARTGHLGNWQEIAAGRGCALDHNATVCGDKKLGYPLIIDFNQTENDNLSTGDSVYLPGSIINKSERKILELYTFDGKNFLKRSREKSYFVPFTLTPFDEELIPLTRIHRKHCSVYKTAKFSSTLLAENHQLVKTILISLIEYSAVNKTNTAPLNLNDIIDRVVTIDAQVSRADLIYRQGNYQLGGVSYASAHELADAALLPIKAAHNPKQFFEDIHHFPESMPLLSLPMACAFDYILSNQGGNDEQEKTIHAYFEWGAFDSAGYPPRSGGYYKQKAKIIKKIYQALLFLMPALSPIFFILLPSAIFNLLPNSAYPSDRYYVKKLIVDILERRNMFSTIAPDIMMSQIEELVAKWVVSNHNNLSSYYLGRFSKKRSIHHQTTYHEYGEVVNIAEFEELTTQQACMIIGALHNYILKD